eukprot:UN28348
MLDKQNTYKNKDNFVEVPVRNKIFVGGLASYITVHEMRRYFQQFGPIDFRKSKIMTDRSGKSKGYGFVVFEKREHAANVLSQSVHWVQGKQVNVGPVKEKQLIHKSIAMKNPEMRSLLEKQRQEKLLLQQP